MAKLCDLVEILENNMECVVLKVKDGARMKLIFMGYFNGDETMLRLTKGDDHTCTVFCEGRVPFSWHWGKSGCTPVSDSTQKYGHMVESCIRDDFGIYIGEDLEKRKATLHIKTLEDARGREDSYKLTWWENGNKICILENGEYLTHVDGLENAKAFIRDRAEVGYESGTYRSPDTGCCIIDMKGRRK